MFYFLKQIKKELTRNTFDYLLLLTAGVLFLISVNIFRGERLLEFLILLMFVSFYILWGIYHHIIENSLHLKTVIEYVLIAFTVMFLLKIVILPH